MRDDASKRLSLVFNDLAQCHQADRIAVTELDQNRTASPLSTFLTAVQHPICVSYLFCTTPTLCNHMFNRSKHRVIKPFWIYTTL